MEMLKLRKSEERGRGSHGWLNSHHSFSFAGYHDPSHMGVSYLRVINEDRVAPGAGFATHAHRDMEIVSYVLEGALEHRDNLGNRALIQPGEVQRMSAGTGVSHSEYNASDTLPVHFLQIWVLPDTAGLEPSYEQRAYSTAERTARWRLVASGDGREGSVRVHQDMALYATLLPAGEVVEFVPASARVAYLFIARGTGELNGLSLSPGDAVEADAQEVLRLTATGEIEALLFDLPQLGGAVG
ncbi:pirin family protein [Acidihalobacter yilgarnensis]|nr:pirin family protein [Acidihalobacter yilgarnensis]